MRILLDENLDWRLKRALVGHHVESVQSNGMAGLKNGRLLAQAEQSFELFITMDGNIQFQQNYSALKLCIVALKARSNRLADTEPLMVKLLARLSELTPGKLLVLE